MIEFQNRAFLSSITIVVKMLTLTTCFSMRFIILVLCYFLKHLSSLPIF